MKKILFLPILTLLIINGCSSSNKNYAVANYVLSTPPVPEVRYNKDYNIGSGIQSFRNDSDNLDGQVNIDNFKDEMLQYLNDVRATGNSCSGPINKSLQWNGVLQQAATVHAKDMALNNIFSHNGSGTSQDIAKKAQGVGSRFYERISYFGYPVRANTIIGETLGMSKTNLTHSNKLFPNFKREINNLLNSTRHCAIIMNPRFDYVGIGIYKVLNKYYFVFDFAQKLKGTSKNR